MSKRTWVAYLLIGIAFLAIDFLMRDMARIKEFRYIVPKEYPTLTYTEQEHIERALQFLFPDSPGFFDITRLPDGLSFEDQGQAKLFKVTRHDQSIQEENPSYLFREMINLSTKTRKRVVQASLIGRDLGVSPKILYVSDDKKLLAREFIEGNDIYPQKLKNEDLFKTIVHKIKALHTGPLLSDAGRSLMKRTRALVIRLNKDSNFQAIPLVQALEAMATIESAFNRAPDKVLSHLDLNPGNIIESPDGNVFLIDWDDSGLDERFADLGIFSHLMNLDEAQKKKLLKFYFNNNPLPEHHAKLNLMEQISHLRVAAWAYSQALKRDPKDTAFIDAFTRDNLLNNYGLPTGKDFLNDYYSGKVKLETSEDFQRLGHIFWREFFLYISSEAYIKDLELVNDISNTAN